MKLNIKPIGHRVLVKPTKIEKTSTGGIILGTLAVDNEQRAATTGVVLAIGELAWSDFQSPEPWAKVGDEVIFKAHAGMRIKNREEDEDFLLLMNDADLAGIRTETKND